MSASSAGAPSECAVLEDAECVSRDEQELIGRELRIHRRNGCEVEARSCFLTAFVELAVEVGDHLVVERVDLLLVGLALGKPGADPGDVQHSGAERLRGI